MDEDTDKMVAALNRIADEIAAHLAWMRERKAEDDAKRTRLPPNDYRPTPLLAGQWPRRDGNSYGAISNANPETGNLRSTDER